MSPARRAVAARAGGRRRVRGAAAGRRRAARPGRARSAPGCPASRGPVKEDLRGIGEAQRGPHLVLLARDAGRLAEPVPARLAGEPGRAPRRVPRFSQALLARAHGGPGRAVGLPATARSHGGCGPGDRDGARAVAERYAALFGRRRIVGRRGSGFFARAVAPPAARRRLARVRDRRALADELGLPVVVTNDVHYALPEDRELAGRPDRDPPRPDARRRSADLRRPDGESYLKAAAELLALPPGDAVDGAADPVLARAWGEGIATSAELAAAVPVDLGFEQYRFPGFPVPDGETPFSYLSELCWEGARRRYHPLTPAVVKRLAHELDVIERAGLAEFFLICWDLMRFAKERGIPAQGRGSAARLDRGVRARDHPGRADRPQPPVRAVHQRGPDDLPGRRHRLQLGAARGGHPVRLPALRAGAHGDGLQPRHVPGAVGGARGGLRAGVPAAAGRPGGEGARDVRQRDGPAGPRGRRRVRRVLRAAGRGRRGARPRPRRGRGARDGRGRAGRREAPAALAGRARARRTRWASSNHARGGRRSGGRGRARAPARLATGCRSGRAEAPAGRAGIGDAALRVAERRRGEVGGPGGERRIGRLRERCAGPAPAIRRGGPADDEGGPGDTPASVAWLRAGPRDRLRGDRRPALAAGADRGTRARPGERPPDRRRADAAARPARRWDPQPRRRPSASAHVGRPGRPGAAAAAARRLDGRPVRLGALAGALRPHRRLPAPPLASTRAGCS